jgi:hypothetical protein
MKLQILIMMAMLALPGFGAEAKKAEPAKKAAAASKQDAVKPPAGLPKSAVEVEPGLFRHIDDKGQVWMYRRTPFGFSRYQPEREVKDVDLEESQYLTAIDKGDSVQFERKTPFGVNKWTRRKAELSGAERLAYEKAVQGKAATATTKPAQE